jgi:hypothetical protein
VACGRGGGETPGQVVLEERLDVLPADGINLGRHAATAQERLDPAVFALLNTRVEPERRIELLTYALRVRCSAV